MAENLEPKTNTNMGPIGFQELTLMLVIGLVSAVVVVLPFWLICKKAGLSPWLSLIGILPFGPLILPFVLAFVDWPSLRSGRPSKIDPTQIQ